MEASCGHGQFGRQHAVPQKKMVATSPSVQQSRTKCVIQSKEGPRSATLCVFWASFGGTSGVEGPSQLLRYLLISFLQGVAFNQRSLGNFIKYPGNKQKTLFKCGHSREVQTEFPIPFGKGYRVESPSSSLTSKGTEPNCFPQQPKINSKGPYTL